MFVYMSKLITRLDPASLGGQPRPRVAAGPARPSQLEGLAEVAFLLSIATAV
jgi:hypothetical protein